MDNIGAMIVNNDSPDSIRDAIISSLYSKAAERVEAAKPYVAASLFDDKYKDVEDYDDEDEEEDEEDYEDDEEEYED